MKTVQIIKNVGIIGLVGIISGCATGYQQVTAMTITGGYDQKDLGRNVYRVSFGANGYTTRETTQSFWLYRCAELALEKGFDGFEIISDITLTQRVPIDEAFGLPGKRFELAQYVPIYIPMETAAKPYLEGDILLLKGEILAQPPRVFDARALIQAMDPYVREAIEKRKNVPSHIHEYLLPEGKLEQKQEV